MVAVFPSTSCNGFAFDPDGEVVDEICAMTLFEARFVLVAAVIVGCNAELDNFILDIWELLRLFGEESPAYVVVVPFNTDAGGLMLT